MKKSKIIILGIIISSFIMAIFLYSHMPDKMACEANIQGSCRRQGSYKMASHWNIDGEVDSYVPKFWGVFLMPIISVGLLFLFMLIPKIDPLKENIEKFRKYFDGFIILIILYLFYIYILTILWNIGARFNMGQLIIPATGILFYYAGILIENSKRNWFIGIRTPWTLSNEKVWDKTHKVGGRLFKVAGIIAVLGIFFSRNAIFFVITPVILITVYTFIYSYFEYKKKTA